MKARFPYVTQNGKRLTSRLMSHRYTEYPEQIHTHMQTEEI